jgi:PAS domain S-box-containing protein
VKGPLVIDNSTNTDHDLKQELDRLRVHLAELEQLEVERQTTQKALRAGEARYRTLFNASTDAVFLETLEGRILDCNDAACEMYGYSREELLTLTVADLVPPEIASKLPGIIDQEVSQGGLIVKAVGLRRDGVLFPTEVSTKVVTIEGGPLVIAYVRDISEQKAAEEALSGSQQALHQRQLELESLLETGRALSSILDLNELLSVIAARALNLLETDECTLFLLEEDGLTLAPILSVGEYSAEMMATPLRVGEGITGYSVAHNIPVCANNAHQDPRAVQVQGTPEGEHEHIMAAPLVFRDRITGAMLVSRMAKQPFNDDNFRLFIGFAQQAAVAIENARLYKESQRHAADLEERVAERTAELEAANLHLKALSQVKDEFVSNVSHELRTPITNLKLYHELMIANPAGAQHYLATLQRETSRLERIIEDLLYLSRLDQRRVEMSPGSVQLDTLAGVYLVDRTPLAESRGLSIRFEVSQPIPPVRGDQMMLGQAFSVLLTNALNYTPSGGEVVVSTLTRREDDQLWVGLRVADTGPGIPPEEQAHLFERFYRGQIGRNSGAPGIGLGLSIAREIVEQHAGQIEMSSRGIPGEGAAFTIWLPAQIGDGHRDNP